MTSDHHGGNMPASLDVEIPETFNMATTLVDRHIHEGRGDHIAIYSGDQVITFAELLGRVNRTGNMLRNHGVEIEDRVIIFMPDRPEFIESYVGAMKIGAVPVPINTATDSKDLEYYVNDSRAAAIVVDRELEPRVAAFRDGCRYLKRVFVVGSGSGAPERCLSYEAEFQAASEALDPEPTHCDDPSYWLYSSGTTGRPKGTVHLQRDMVYCTANWLKHVRKPVDGDINYSVSKLPFSYGLVNALYQPLFGGFATVLAPEPPTPQAVVENIKRYRPTALYSVPTIYNSILREHEAGRLNVDLSSVRLCISAGEALPGAVYDRFLETFGVEILDGIGSTEFGYIYIQNLPGCARAASSGHVLPGYEARILDPDGDEVPVGDTGELFMQSESFAAYYWKKRDQTRNTFRGPWLKTGDLYMRDSDDYFFYMGRADDMIKSSGQWISPIEVEGILLRHEGVAEAAVVEFQDTDGLPKPMAFVVLKENFSGSAELVTELQEWVKQHVDPHFYKYPRRIAFIRALPKTATGKIQRYKLREMALKGEFPE
jgi:benzoate-CoA ligase family protein